MEISNDKIYNFDMCVVEVLNELVNIEHGKNNIRSNFDYNKHLRADYGSEKYSDFLMSEKISNMLLIFHKVDKFALLEFVKT